MLSSRGGSKGLSTLESMITGLIAGKRDAIARSKTILTPHRVSYFNY